MQAPKSEFNLSVTKLCYNGNYNSVLYVLLSLSNVILILIVFSFLKVLRRKWLFLTKILNILKNVDFNLIENEYYSGHS